MIDLGKTVFVQGEHVPIEENVDKLAELFGIVTMKVYIDFMAAPSNEGRERGAG